jgi:hypothetical protein
MVEWLYKYQRKIILVKLRIGSAPIAHLSGHHFDLRIGFFLTKHVHQYQWWHSNALSVLISF